MTLPRWAESQIRVEDALRAGVTTRAALIEHTGLSHKTVVLCLGRAHVETTRTWPREYTLIRSALADFDEPGPDAEIIAFTPRHIVAPVEFEIETLGPLWQKGRAKLGSEIEETDMSRMERDEVLHRLETFTAQALGVIVALRLVEDSPEWREVIGLA